MKRNTTSNHIRLVMAALAMTGSVSLRPAFATDTTTPTPSPAAALKVPAKAAEPQGKESSAVAPQVQSQVEKSTAGKHAQLLKDAQAALDETNKALQALNDGKKDDALTALAEITGKLDLIVARDPKLALAPVGEQTIVRDLYAGPDTARNAVTQVKDYLSAGKVQQARILLNGLASEADVQVTSIPLGTYPEAIKAVVPLIDDGKIAEAKAALSAALSTLVIETYPVPLPNIRATAILVDAEKLAEKTARSADENKKLRDEVEAARQELQLGEVLGYGTKDDFKPLYTQLDGIEKKTEGGKSGAGFFDKIKELLKNFKLQL